MGKIVRYDHNGIDVAVDADLRGMHRGYCLCYRCAKFHPASLRSNCAIAQVLYRLDILAGITTPVWECADFKEGA